MTQKEMEEAIAKLEAENVKMKVKLAKKEQKEEDDDDDDDDHLTEIEVSEKLSKKFKKMSKKDQRNYIRRKLKAEENLMDDSWDTKDYILYGTALIVGGWLLWNFIASRTSGGGSGNAAV